MSKNKTAAPEKKGENKTWKLAAPIVVLACICLVVSAALAGANTVTKPVIEEANRKAADAAMQVVLPEGSDFTDLTAEGLPAAITEAKSAGNGAGYVFTVATKGFGGDMSVMIGMSADGKITGTKVLVQAETQGIGSKVVNDGSDFQLQLIGMSDTSGIVATSGASVSSKGVTDAVQSAFDAYTILSGGTVEVKVAPRPETLTDDILAGVYPGASFTEVPGGMVSDAGTVVFATGSGMDGDVPVAVFFDAGGAILGINVDATHETPGLGTLCGEADFMDQFKGVSSGDEVDAISGSTVTSDAVKSAVNDAIANLETVKGAA